jgi:HigB_toxin, RelE-like toxic component of a toxin-antitoxin system
LPPITRSLGVWNPSGTPETPNAKSDRQQGLIPILRNLNLTSDIAKRKVYIQHVLTHKEYDRGTWKDD